MKKKLLTIFTTIAFIFSSSMFIYEVWKGYNEESVFDALRQPILNEVNDSNDDKVEKKEDLIIDQLLYYKELYELNDDFIGWIKIDNTQIDYPVMHTPDNEEYYLYRDFNKRNASSGTPFLDASNILGKDNQQYIIYSHNMRNGSMFKDLLNYKDVNFYKENTSFNFNTKDIINQYIIYAAFEIDVLIGNGHYDFYNYTNLDNEDDFNNFVSKTKELSIYDTGITPKYGDNILTLVTCENYTDSNRMVIIAIRK